MLLTQQSELEAFDCIYYRYSEAIFAFLLSISKDYYLAEEVTQNVFLLLWRKKSLLDKSRSLKALLFSIAHNEMISFFRKQKSESIKREKFYAAFPSDITMEVEYEVEYQNLKELSDYAIEQLPPKMREVYKLSRDTGLTNKEISEQLNISIKTVENHITAALRSLKKQLPFLFY